MAQFGRPHSHPSEISALRSCPAESGADLLAVGGYTFLEILRQDIASPEPSYVLVSSLHLGSRITAIAWSPRTRSPLFSSEEWLLELAVACADEKMRIIHVAPDQDPVITIFGEGPSGHKGTVNDVCFCVSNNDEARYLASVGDDRKCIIWDLYPPPVEEDPNDPAYGGSNSRNESQEPPRTPSPSRSISRTILPPAAYPIPFDQPLHTVCAHPHDARSLLVSDSQGVLTVLNWMEGTAEELAEEGELGATEGQGQNGARKAVRPSLSPATFDFKRNSQHQLYLGHRRVEFVDPSYSGRSAAGLTNIWSGGASWKPDDPDVFGATFGSSWHVWTQRSMQGGKPLISGEAFAEGSDCFKWCPTNSRLFAISATSPALGAFIKVFDINFPKNSRSVTLAPRPNYVRMFDWIGTTSQESQDSPAWMAVAVGRKVVLVAAGSLE